MLTGPLRLLLWEQTTAGLGSGAGDPYTTPGEQGAAGSRSEGKGHGHCTPALVSPPDELGVRRSQQWLSGMWRGCGYQEPTRARGTGAALCLPRQQTRMGTTGRPYIARGWERKGSFPSVSFSPWGWLPAGVQWVHRLKGHLTAQGAPTQRGMTQGSGQGGDWAKSKVALRAEPEWGNASLRLSSSLRGGDLRRHTRDGRGWGPWPV